MADDYLNLLPLFPTDTEDAIRARWIDWANEGLDPALDGDRWVDTREGGHWRTAVEPGIRESARIYDLMGTEVVAAAMPLWSWGTWLDDIGEGIDVLRLAATYATGIVTFTGPEGTNIPAGTQVEVVPASDTDPAPVFQTTEAGVLPAPVLPATDGVLDLPVRAVLADYASNVGPHSIQTLSVPIAGVTVDNADPTLGGTDPEDDEALRTRVLEAFEGSGGGNKNDYKRWALAEPGVGEVTVIPHGNGPDTVVLIIMDPNGQPVSAAIVDALQASLDPTAGKGDGIAPINHAVTVETASILDIAVAGTIHFETGYSLDGAAGSVALGPQIIEAIGAYVNAVESGDEVVLAQVEGRIVSIRGVHDLTGLTLNGAAANVAVPSAPPEVPRLGDTSGLVEA